MRSRAVLVPVALLCASGCLASKSDIRLLQDELRATRAQLAVGDTSILRADQARAGQIAALSASIDRMNDSLRILTARFASFQATALGEFDAMGKQMVQMQALLGQTTRNIQSAQAQLEALREQGGVVTAPPNLRDSLKAVPGSMPAPAGPGASTIFLTAKDQYDNGAYSLARAAFQKLLTDYPTSDQAPRAQLYVGETFQSEGNFAAADSVFLLVATRYPKSPEAATGLFRHAKKLWDENRKQEARPFLNRVVREYPNSDEARLAKALLDGKA